MDITKLSKNALKMLLGKHISQELLSRGAGNEEKSKKHHKIASLISAELSKR